MDLGFLGKHPLFEGFIDSWNSLIQETIDYQNFHHEIYGFPQHRCPFPIGWLIHKGLFVMPFHNSIQQLNDDADGIPVTGLNLYSYQKDIKLVVHTINGL